MPKCVGNNQVLFEEYNIFLSFSDFDKKSSDLELKNRLNESILSGFCIHCQLR